MEIVLLLSVAVLCIAVIGLILCACLLFAPRYEHRNPMLGQKDLRIDNRFERLWNKRQDEIEAGVLRCTCHNRDGIACDVHPTAKIEAVKNLCPGCGNEIDPEVCCCGELVKNGYHDNHNPVPMGCQCLYSK